MPFNRIFIILFFLLASTTSGFAASPPPVNIDSNTESYPLKSGFNYFIDDSSKMTLEKILSSEVQDQFIPSGNKALNIGVTNSTCWIKFSLHNPAQTAKDLILELGTSTINSVTLFIPKTNGHFFHKTTGDIYPIEERDFFHRRPCFSFKIKPESTETYYLRLKTDAILETSLTVIEQKIF